MDEIEVKELAPSEYKEWDSLVEKVQPGTLFHTSDWLGISRDTLSRELRIYGCYKNGEIVGGCPLFVRNLKGMLNVGYSTCIMTDYCGPLIKENRQFQSE